MNLDKKAEEKRLLKVIARYPRSILHEIGVNVTKEELEKKDGMLDSLLKNMFDVMYFFNGIGLAAQQVRSNKRVLIVDLSNDSSSFEGSYDVNTNEKIAPQKLIMINPEIVELSDETDSYNEGCLSLPNIRIPVVRPKKVKVKFLNHEGKEHFWHLEKLLGRCVQHEIDHLNGILIIDKIPKNMWKLYCATQLTKLKNDYVEDDQDF
jgi:peptide deformylase